jgi:hypothetical protein
MEMYPRLNSDKATRRYGREVLYGNLTTASRVSSRHQGWDYVLTCTIVSLMVDAYGMGTPGNLQNIASTWGQGKWPIPPVALRLDESSTELRITGTTNVSLTEIQAFAKSNNTPCLQLSATDGQNNTQNYKAYQLLAGSLHAKGTVSPSGLFSPYTLMGLIRWR